MFIRLLIMVCLLFLFSLWQISGQQPDPTFSNLVYATVGGKSLKLDLYLPEHATRPVPLVIRVHGGAWQSGNKYPLPSYMAPILEQGLAVASVQYRLTSQAGQYGDEGVIFPVQIHDVKGAVRWLRAHAAQYNVDPARFGAWGSSAGGHLVALLGVSGDVPELEGDVGGNLEFSSRVQVVADYYGPTEILYITEDETMPPGSTLDHDSYSSPEAKLFGWDQPGQGLADIKNSINHMEEPYPYLVSLCNLANPITHVSPEDAVFLVAHGRQDTTIPIHQSTKFVSALSMAGVSVQYIEVPDRGHGGFSPLIHAAVIDFLVSNLSHPQPWADINGDGTVDFLDLGILLSQWGYH